MWADKKVHQNQIIHNNKQKIHLQKHPYRGKGDEEELLCGEVRKLGEDGRGPALRLQVLEGEEGLVEAAIVGDVLA